jgi:hypothetical protein
MGITGIILASLFVLVGMALTGAGVRFIWKARHSRTWPQTVGLIHLSEVKIDNSGDGTTYQARVRYSYTVDGTNYQAGRVYFGDALFSGLKAHSDRIVRPYQKGEPITVYYNPRRPREAVLEPGQHWQSLCGLPIGLLLLGMGIVGLVLLPGLP